jgi:hypothetical protein
MMKAELGKMTWSCQAALALMEAEVPQASATVNLYGLDLTDYRNENRNCPSHS